MFYLAEGSEFLGFDEEGLARYGVKEEKKEMDFKDAVKVLVGFARECGYESNCLSDILQFAFEHEDDHTDEIADAYFVVWCALDRQFISVVKFS